MRGKKRSRNEDTVGVGGKLSQSLGHYRLFKKTLANPSRDFIGCLKVGCHPFSLKLMKILYMLLNRKLCVDGIFHK